MSQRFTFIWASPCVDGITSYDLRSKLLEALWFCDAWLNDNIYWLGNSNFCATETTFIQQKKELWREAAAKKGNGSFYRYRHTVLSGSGRGCLDWESLHGLNFRTFTTQVTFWSHFTNHVIRWRTDQAHHRFLLVSGLLWARVGVNDPVMGRIQKYVYQTDDSLLLIWPLKSWLAINFIAIKSRLYNFLLLLGLTSKPRHDTYIC